MSCSGVGHSFTIASLIRGYHIHQDIWTPTINEELSCEQEIGNRHDTFAVATRNEIGTVGLVPQYVSHICSVFIRRGGAISSCVTGSRQYSADLEKGGMNIPGTNTSTQKFIKGGRKPEKSLKEATKNSSAQGASLVSELSVIDFKQSETKVKCVSQLRPSTAIAAFNDTIHINAKDVIDMLSESEEEIDEPPQKKI